MNLLELSTTQLVQRLEYYKRLLPNSGHPLAEGTNMVCLVRAVKRHLDSTEISLHVADLGARVFICDDIASSFHNADGTRVLIFYMQKYKDDADMYPKVLKCLRVLTKHKKVVPQLCASNVMELLIKNMGMAVSDSAVLIRRLLYMNVAEQAKFLRLGGDIQETLSAIARDKPQHLYYVLCDLASNFDLLGNEPCNKIVKSVVGGLSRYENLTEAGLFCKLLANINRNSCTDKAYRLSLGHIANVYGVINKYGKKGGDLQRALLNEAPPDVLLDSVSILKFLLTYQRNERDLLKVISLTLNVNNLKTNEFRNIVIIALEKLSDALRNELNANEFASDAVNICTTMDNFKDDEAVQKAAINAVSALSKHDKQNITQVVICKVVHALVKFETSEDIQKSRFLRSVRMPMLR